MFFTIAYGFKAALKKMHVSRVQFRVISGEIVQVMYFRNIHITQFSKRCN